MVSRRVKFMEAHRLEVREAAVVRHEWIQPCCWDDGNVGKY